MGKVLAIGLDAASLPMIQRLIDAGRLPNLQRLQTGSARWSIDGGDACLRNLQWAQFNFGRRIENDRGTMFAFEPDTYHCMLNDVRHQYGDAPQFWDRDDVRSLVFDIPESATVKSATAVTAWGCHAAFFARSSNPPGLVDEIDRTIGIHPGYGNDFDAAWHDREATIALADALVVGAERRAAGFKLLNARHAWDMAIVVMSEMHSAGHFWWHGDEPTHPLRHAANAEVARSQLHRVYEAVDAAVGEIVAAAPPDAAIAVFSHDDMRYGHGDTGTLALLPELLQRKYAGGPLLKSANAEEWKAAGCPPVIPRPGWVWRQHMDSMLLQPPTASRLKQLDLYAKAKQSGLGRRVIRMLKGRPLGAVGVPIPAEVTSGVFDHDRSRADDTNDLLFTAHYQPHWSKMRAFALPSFNPGVVRINLAGRERDGVVALDDYDATCDEIEAMIRSCVHPRTGRSIIAAVDRPRRSAPMDPDGDVGDLVFRWAPDTLIDALEHPELGLVGPVPAHRSGAHGSAGFLFVAKDGIEAGDRGERPACDIPATLIALAGGRPTAYLDGRSVLDAIPSG